MLAVLVLAAAVAFLTAPDVSPLRKSNPKETAMMRYRENQAKQNGLRSRRLQSWVPLSRISQNLIQAVLISEDDKFFMHAGFDWEGIRDALEKNLRYGHIVGGGSTITQQLAKNLYLSPTRNPVRKIREAVLAFLLDKKLTKKRILELYLNVIEWGRGVYGAEAAAQVYFRKPALELSLPESVRLASILPSPIRFGPEGTSSPWMVRRRRSIADRMLRRHFITQGQYRLILADVDPESAVAFPDTAAVRMVLPAQADTTDTDGGRNPLPIFEPSRPDSPGLSSAVL